MWQKNVTELMAAQCKWEEEKDLCNQRMANKKGGVVCFFAFRQENTLLLMYRTDLSSCHIYKLSEEFTWTALKARAFLPGQSDACHLALIDAKEQSLTVLWVTFHSLEAFIILYKEAKFC